MIVILSVDGDYTTNKVIDWLIFFKTPYIRVNLEDEDPKNINLVISNSHIDFRFKLKNGTEIIYSNVDYFFYRGGLFPKIKDIDFIKNNTSKLPEKFLAKQLENDLTILVDLFYKLIRKKSIGAPQLKPINKLEVLTKAKEVGFKIPHSVVANNIKFLKYSLSSPNDKLIGKAISETVSLTDELNENHYDLNVCDIDISLLSNDFFPSLFQNKVIRKQEIRVFIFGEYHYSVVIESNNTDVREDFSENKYKKHTISEETFIKCKNLLEKCNLSSGSFDLIIDNDMNLYFLEVNPIGQFDFVSQIGNYNIEYEIAAYLTQKVKI